MKATTKLLFAFRYSVCLILMACSFVVSACSDSRDKPAPPRPEQSMGAAELESPEIKPSPTPTQSPSLKPSAPTFEKDVLPILGASETQRIYRCTVCHATFNDYDVVAKPAVVQSMITSMENGRMPVNGDKVKAADLNVIRAWFAAGMPKE